ncbi:MAG: hypothetical protein M1831_006666 [Alyxoria varia]|nr:MAG: hypothetical protein M1831_006666 [Alyxoria varia]
MNATVPSPPSTFPSAQTNPSSTTTTTHPSSSTGPAISQDDSFPESLVDLPNRRGTASSKSNGRPAAKGQHHSRSFSTDSHFKTFADITRLRRSASTAQAAAPAPRDHSPPAPNPSHTSAMIESFQDPPSGTARAFYQRNKGLFYVLLAQVFGTLMNVTTRLLEIEGNEGAGMHPFQILFTRMMITTTLSTFYMWWTEIPDFPFGMPEVRVALAIRGIGGFFGVFGMYYSLIYLPLADATVLTFIAPSLSCFACSFLLKEPFTRVEQLGALVSFLGVILIARPGTLFQSTVNKLHARDEPAPPPAQQAPAVPLGGPKADAMPMPDAMDLAASQRLGAVCVALVGVVGSATAFTAMRWIGKRAHPLLSVNYFCAWCTFVSGLAMIILPGVDFLLPANSKEWTYLVFLGCCGFAMQFLLSAGLQHEKSSRATNMVYTQMFFALVFDKLVFGTTPTLLSLLGSSLILGSAIYVTMQKESIKQRQDAEKARQEAERSSGMSMEMMDTRSRSMSRPDALRDEERGLGVGIDETEEIARQNGTAKSVG